jgi:hypothetical protein
MEAHRGVSTSERVKIVAASGKGISKKRPRLGKVAESWQNRLSVSFGVGRRREVHVGAGGSAKAYR